ncbi:MAG: hypothetical protein EZS28_054493, partial [Streblomastix strix]
MPSCVVQYPMTVWKTMTVQTLKKRIACEKKSRSESPASQPKIQKQQNEHTENLDQYILIDIENDQKPNWRRSGLTIYRTTDHFGITYSPLCSIGTLKKLIQKQTEIPVAELMIRKDISGGVPGKGEQSEEHYLTINWKLGAGDKGQQWVEVQDQELLNDIYEDHTDEPFSVQIIVHLRSQEVFDIYPMPSCVVQYPMTVWKTMTVQTLKKRIACEK